MKKLLRSIYTLPFFINAGRPLFAMAKVRALEPVSLRMARSFARLVHFAHGVREHDEPRELADEWNRLMPTPREAFPVIDVEGDTAFVEIRIECPLRGSGDAEACWRSMEFDRALIRESGGELVVMESQSITGGSCCRLAIRPKGASFDESGEK